ncbi:SMP-30/gluconolactonase/LRE family protein [Halodurantibacterium flavum]|uniref:SMP-30/gluconolactonase/LRE family protein n=1 Tax=Halodurantibacterium flavum TaxID=1382802 RepID=A0ABW4SAN0_9RHOB
MTAFDPRPCALGEGAFWHPARQQFFWFDILGRRLLSRRGEEALEWRFNRMASAAGWIDADRLLIATETGLAILDLEGGGLSDHVAVEEDQPETRSNDGRADRLGGFWFGTMGKGAEDGAGAIYRYWRGTVHCLFSAVSIPNAITFSPDGRIAHFADTAEGLVWTQALDAEGWPEGPRQVFLDLRAEGLNPDGAVIDAEGGFWCAKYGAGAVMRYDTAGRCTHRLPVPGLQSTCPAFGGADLAEMIVTTAYHGGPDDAAQGRTYHLRPGMRGLPEPRVIL